MKKSAVLIGGLFLLMDTAFAGGILTKTNQSAQFIRMVSRNASTDIDAVYYNPAGLGQLENGFYFSLNNQSLYQTYTVNSEFKYLNNPEYIGDMNAPLFPTAFAVYKKDKWSVSLGFGPNAGGGSITYATGLPSFEKQISTLPISLSSQGLPTTSYTANLRLEGSSVFWGTQLNGSYSINDVVTVSLGVRMINAVNTYNGYIKDIMINPTNPVGGNFGWDGSMRTASSVFTTLSNTSKGAALMMQPVITGGGGNSTLSQLQQAGFITATQAAILAGGLGTDYNPAMTASQVQSAYVAKADGLAGRAAATADKNVDVEQTGWSATPIIGVNLHFEKLNIGLKYEHITYLGLFNNTTEDGTGLFPDGGKTGSDIPPIIAGGADYQISDKLKISGSFTYFLDNLAGWGNNVYGQARTIDNNYLELSLGAEYKLTDKFTLSAGYLNSNAGVSEDYLSDFSYVNDANGVGAGFQWKLSDRLTLDAGAMVISYKDQIKNFDASFDPLAAAFGPYKETYAKESYSFAFGISYKIF